MSATIKISEFMDHLKANDLVIVSRKDLLDSARIDLDLKRYDLLQKKDISIKEIVDAKFLPVTTKAGVRNWITDGRFKELEVFKNTAGQIRILTSAIKRLRNES